MTIARVIPLTGKYATDAHRFVIVDDADFERFSDLTWKAWRNPSSSRIYAVRNIKRDGKLITLRLNREILGLGAGDTLDAGFANGDTLDCRRANLRAVSRSELVGGAKIVKQNTQCSYCRTIFAYLAPGYVDRCYCSTDCKDKAERRRRHKGDKAVLKIPCGWCGALFIKRRSWSQYCSSNCRHAAKNAKRREAQRA